MAKAVDAPEAGLAVVVAGVHRHLIGAHLRRSLIAGSVNPQHVAEVPRPGLVHPAEKIGVGHGDGPGGCGRRQPGADDDGLRIGLLDRLIGQSEHGHVLGGIGGVVPPFAGQIGFVPDLVGLDPPPVARGQGGEKIGEVLQPVRRADPRKEGIAPAPP
ncbi:MAG: hypothetical protein C4289_10250, partial [Chloroflexota bacterium]